MPTTITYVATANNSVITCNAEWFTPTKWVWAVPDWVVQTDTIATYAITHGVIACGVISCDVNWIAWNDQLGQVRGVASNPEYEARLEQQKVAQISAQKKAEALLLENLNKDQIEQFRKERSFVVHVKRPLLHDRTYRVRYGTAGNVDLLDAKGKAISRFCIHPDTPCPTEDVMLAQKLLLEGDEAMFLRIANKTRIAA